MIKINCKEDLLKCMRNELVPDNPKVEYTGIRGLLQIQLKRRYKVMKKFYFIVDHEDKNMTLKDKAIQETMDEIGFPIYSTIAGPSTRDSLFMKKEFQENDISLMNIVFVATDLRTIVVGEDDMRKIYDIIKESDTSIDMAKIVGGYLKKIATP